MEDKKQSPVSDHKPEEEKVNPFTRKSRDLNGGKRAYKETETSSGPSIRRRDPKEAKVSFWR